MIKILANDGISKAGVLAMQACGLEVITTKVAQDQLSKFINENGVSVLLVRSATKVRKELIDACPSIKLIGRGGVGMDNIDVEYAKQKGIKVINTPASSSMSVAELVFAHLFSGVRFLHDSNRQMPLVGDTKFEDLKKAYAKGIELRGKTIGIIGIGRIGQATAQMALGLGMNVVACDSFIEKITVTVSLFQGQSISVELKTIPLDSVLKQSDFVSLHVPAQDGYVIGKKQLELMKDGAALVNAARGGLVDEVALIQALDSGKLAFAGLDVFEGEPTPSTKLLMHPKVSLTPHIGAATEEAQDRIGVELAEQVAAFFKK